MIATNPISPALCVLIAGLGWLLGILVNYLADVLPITRRISQPTCLYCASPYSIRDYLFFTRCRTCHASRSKRTWFVQFGCAIFLLLAGIITLRRIDFGVAALLLVYFAVVVVIDMEYRIILHPVSLVGAIGGVILGWQLNGLESTILGGIAGFLIMLSLYYLGILFVRVVNRSKNVTVDEVALGFGDVNLGGVIGLMLGWMDIIGGLLLAILLGGVISGFLILINWISRRYRPLTAIPYGPFLVVGAMIYLFVPVYYF
jgi:leader peptidase (prepilin peptidase) / N-methyltransferase